MSGFFGSISKKNCGYDVYYGTDYNSHLGTRRGGMCILNEEGFTRAIHSLENDYFRTKFEPELSKMVGNSGIGIISDWEAQPIVVNSHLGRFAVAVVGKVANLEELEQRALKQHRHFSELQTKGINQTELIAMLITEQESFVDGINHVFDQIKGSCSMLLLTQDGIIAARDKYGRTPIIVGKKDGAYAVSSETISFPNLGYSIDQYMGPGEIVKITAEGKTQLQAPGKKMQVCSFLWVYYGYPGSSYENIDVDNCRYRCGSALAKSDNVDIDFVGGIPDSGIGHALGYANERKLPYCRGFVKYTPTWPRSFMPQKQEDRSFIAKMKLIPNRDLIQGKRMVFCDDSIVRGTQLKDNTHKLFSEGAKEVHMRIACPVLVFPCEYLNFSTSRTSLDLIGRKVIYEMEGTENTNYYNYIADGSSKQTEMEELIRRKLNLTSLKFQKLHDLVAAIGLPKEKLCTHCWDGSSYS
ncbi:MAG TPA: amidophosphoribosyltransferase [Bacteroidales bacterium]|nr:amidophosphoribosyltransferase [Bacteroidales bacterium]